MKLLTILIILIPLFCFSQIEERQWDFPVKPGYKEWNALRTEKDRISAMQVPTELLNRMTSEDLILTCVNFPLFGYFTAFNTPQEGFNIMFSRFNIFSKICEKDSVGKHLIKVYEDAGMNGWRSMGNKLHNKYWTLKLNYLEYLIGQNEIVLNLDKKEKIQLMKLAKLKYNQKRANESFNSLSGISSSLLLISRILNSDKMLTKSSGELKLLQHFLDTGQLDNTEIIDKILNSSELYLNL